MTPTSPLAAYILRDLEIAVLRRKGPDDYELLGQVPDFYQRLFPDENGQPSIRPWKKSSMLDFFLHDAELFFAHNGQGSLNSGIWQEDGMHIGKQALTATAMCCEGEQLLILRLLGDEYVDRTRIMQKARETLLERRELHQNVETYKQRATYDKLTGLFNRAHFDEALEHKIQQTAARGGELSLLMMDIDDFKTINDVYGHLTGDAVLTQLGRLLGNFVRQDDVACRYGGEEFTVIASKTEQHGAMRMAEKLRRAVADQSFPDLPPITVSIGCAGYRRGESAEGFVNRADLALYDAKSSGKNCVRMR